MVRIALFDWVAGGHHALYARRFAEALSPWTEVIVAAPDETMAELDGLAIERIPLGRARPSSGKRFSMERHRTMTTEVKLLEHVARQSRADHIIHLYADPLLSRLLLRRRMRPTVSALLFYPWAHYPKILGARLSATERVRASVKEVLTAAWRMRPDAHALLTLDEEATQHWRSSRGAPAYWIPEPPVSMILPSVADDERSGCLLYGALAKRKGIDLLAAALAVEPTPIKVMIAGQTSAAYLPTLQEHIAQMRRSGAEVDVRAYRHTESDGLRALAASRCAVLPYPQHGGMSRILLEACSVGTPVVVHNWGLLGYLVRQHGLGLAVDCRDPRALRRAILELAGDPGAASSYRNALAAFASRFSRESFARALRAPFIGSEAGKLEPVVASRVEGEAEQA